jgi:hypothetical protein
MVMYGQLITVMYTGGTRIFPRHETSPSNGSSSESSQSHHGPGPDLTPVESAQAEQPH